MGYIDEEDEESGEIEVQESRTHKMNKLVHDLCDWLLLATCIFLLVYAILYLIYEIALGMAHISWVYNSFLLICLVDCAAYFIARFAVVGGETSRCLLFLAFVCLVVDFFINLCAPAAVIISYELTLEYPLSGSGSGISAVETASPSAEEDKFVHGNSVPQDCAIDNSGVKCGMVYSIRTSIWCMYLLLIPRPLLIYAIISVLRRK